MTNQTDTAVRESRFTLEAASNYAVIVAFIAVVIFFSFAAPSFMTGENIFNLISNKVVLLAIVALGMTIVIGAGGIGCPAIQYLAAAGVGKLTIVDPDIVSLSNLQRQPLFGESDIGATKVQRATDAVRRLNPDVAVTAVTEPITADNAAALLSEAAPDTVDTGMYKYNSELFNES